MEVDPKVSVIIPSFNHKQYIEKAINSVFSQTYENIELIIVDDGSTDGTVELLETLSNKFSFTYVTQKNKGVCKALNRGINKLSTGRYICILASDDFFHIKKVEKQVAALLESDNSEFCYTQAIEFNSQPYQEIRLFPRKSFQGNALRKVFFRQPYAAGSIMFSRGLYERVGGFDNNLKHEDWDFSIRCANATEFISVNETLFFYRSHSYNVMKRTARRNIFREKKKVILKNKDYVPFWVWGGALTIHYIFDHFYWLFKFLNLKRLVN
jgi:alpha-1,3-rhamnosyltransferase